MEIKPRQLEIITAAGKILTDSGVAGLTTKKLAAKMGFAESALYRHFKGKEEIILTMLQYLASDMENRLKSCLLETIEPEQQLKKVFNNQFDFFKKNPYFIVAIFSDGLLEESKAINSELMQIMAVKRKYLLQIIKKGQAEAVFINKLSADDMVHIIMGSVRLHMLQWRMAEFSFDVKVKGNKLMTSILALIKYN